MTRGDSDEGILHPLDCAEWHLWALRISKIVARAWVDEAFKEALVSDPATALEDAGLAVPKGTEVVIDETATGWSMSGSSMAKVDRLVLPLPPKPEADALIRAWAEGETGHPPILSDDGGVSFNGIPAIEDSAARRIVEARRVADARRVGEGRRIASARRIADDGIAGTDAAARRVAEARRIVDDGDFYGSDAVGRRMAEARRIVEDADPPLSDADARRVTEGRRTAQGRRVEESEPPADAEGRRLTEGRRVAEQQDKPEKDES
ncbi:hypothetical protein EI983_16320 [Roseovarius faecimaris]|uniref:Uncharacterized protein n=1 Tax=Roseovarius faecimaris TaxID=2494550 RepID=A0A6I6IWD2_9RHOB|nr:hypothetical protein [Roseovarius faecimaris]QGX99746.1 hypothetical protein EI983_16320 [Roseovarius faecimaris]